MIQNNTAKDNEQSFETWVSGNNPGYTHCKFINNNCYTAGFGWSHSVRPDSNVAVHILSYSWEVMNADFEIKNNSENMVEAIIKMPAIQ